MTGGNFRKLIMTTTSEIVREPYFSICIPVYNGEEFVQKAIDSVLSQTFDDWELVIIEDGSTDRTWELLQKNYSNHPKIRLLKNERNLGQRGNLNRCIQEATGRWVGILPADDFYLSQALEVIHQHTSQQASLILWIHAHLCFGHNRPSDIPLAFPNERTMSAVSMAELIYLKGNIFGELSSFVVKRDAFIRPNCQFSDGTMSVDTRFWLRVLMANPGGFGMYSPQVLAHVLIHANSDSSKFASTNAHLQDFFALPSDLVSLGWRRLVILLQIARMLKCWVKMGSKLPQSAKWLPLQTIRRLLCEVSQ